MKSKVFVRKITAQIGENDAVEFCVFDSGEYPVVVTANRGEFFEELHRILRSVALNNDAFGSLVRDVSVVQAYFGLKDIVEKYNGKVQCMSFPLVQETKDEFETFMIALPVPFFSQAHVLSRRKRGDLVFDRVVRN